MTLREKLLSKTNRRYRMVKIDGEEYWLQSLTDLERVSLDLIQMYTTTAKVNFQKLPEVKARMLCLSLVEGEGKEACFDETEWQQLQSLDSRLVAKLYSACLEHNGYEDKEIEELVGN